MHRQSLPLLMAVWIGVCCVGSAQEPAMKAMIDRLDQSLQQKDANVEVLSRDLFSETDLVELTQQLEQCRQLTIGGEVADVIIEGGRGTLVYDTAAGPVTVEFEYSPTASPTITTLKATRPQQDAAPITWDTLEQEINRAAENGFNGAVLVSRNGEIVFHRAYGFANREKEIKNKPDTVFAIGSAPIDFTHAAILMLRDEGKLNLDDPITKYVKHVPADKQAITIRHLMTGQSGLPDFHDLPTDKDPDHSWIDRAEAIRRIMKQELLFAPGSRAKHSHSAWGLLAAIVEIVSQQSYQDFTRTRLYEPAGMQDTGFFGDKVDEDRVAVGYGFRKSSDPNSPPHWGRTSWLVMGSGGQVSTLPDLFQWEVALREGRVLSERSTKEFVGNDRRVSADGDMYGFEFVHSHNPECMFMIISNAIDSWEKRREFDALGRRLHGLVERELSSNPFSLGILMEFEEASGQVVVSGFAEESAAVDAGMQKGDVLLSANGVEFGDPRDVLTPLLRSGDPIEFAVLRKDQPVKLTVKPRPKQ